MPKNKLNDKNAEDGFETWRLMVDAMLGSPINLAGWVERLEGNPGDLLILAEEFHALCWNFSACSSFFSDEKLPGRESLERHERIADILSAFADRRTSVDSGPLLKVVSVRRSFGEMKIDLPTGDSVDSEAWSRWHTADFEATIAIHRLRLWAATSATNTQPTDEMSLSDKAMLYFLAHPDACILMSQREFAKALGQKSHARVGKTKAWLLIASQQEGSRQRQSELYSSEERREGHRQSSRRLR